MLNQFSLQLARNFVEDVLRVRFQKHPVLKPLVFSYYITQGCNFHCIYCSSFKEGRTLSTAGELDTEQTIRLLGIIRKACPNLYLTGGEPLMRKDIVEVLKAARGLGFSSISMVSNMSLMHRKMEVLDYLDNLTVSLDMLDAGEYAKVLGMPKAVVEQLIRSIVTCAGLQREKRFNLTVNFVLNEHTLPQARGVLEFCLEHGIRFTVGPEVEGGSRVMESLRDNADYQGFIAHLRARKKSSRLLIDTDGYLDAISALGPFPCYPLLTPRVEATGDFHYPCRPLRGEALNLLEIGSYERMVREAVRRSGPGHDCPGTCHMNCYLVPSSFVTAPLRTMRGFL